MTVLVTEKVVFDCIAIPECLILTKKFGKFVRVLVLLIKMIIVKVYLLGSEK